MGVVKKNAWVFFALGLLILFFFTRLYHILVLPIFTDEAIYVRWAQIASTDAAWRFISLTDGKQPMFVWIAMLFMKVIHDPLFAGRFVSVLAGLGSLIGLFFLTSEVFKNKKIGLLASFFYVIYPFSLVYDRMALYDSLVSMFIIWSLYFEILLVRYKRLDLALILGMIIGGGMLTKTNANFALLLLPLLLLLFNFKEKHWKKNLGMLFVFSLAALAIANVMYGVLRLSPFFHIIEIKNYVFVYSFSEWIMNPFAYFFNNFRVLTEWTLQYTTIPFFILIIASFFVEKKYVREKLLLLAWCLLPFIAFAFFGRVIYPRHILFTTMPLIVLAAYTFYYLFLLAKSLLLRVVIIGVFLFPLVVSDYLILTDFVHAPVPNSDKAQFLTSWPSGGGVNETISYLSEKAKKQKIYVGTQGTFGLMPYSLEIYLKDNPNIIIKGFWPVEGEMPEEVVAASKVMPTYFVFYQECPSCPERGIAPLTWNVMPVFQIKKQEQKTSYTLYKVEVK